MESWRWAYADLLPKKYLDGLRLDRNVQNFSVMIGDTDSAQITWVACDDEGCCGLATAGPARSEGHGVGEVYTIYVRERVLRQGVGRMLLAYSVAQLKATCHTSAILWVLEDNLRARRFYEREGWSHDGARDQEEIAGSTFSVVRYRRAL